MIVVKYYCENKLIKSDYYEDNEIFHRPLVGESILVISNKRTYEYQTLEEKTINENKEVIDKANKEGIALCIEKPSLLKKIGNALIEEAKVRLSVKKFKAIYRIKDIIVQTEAGVYKCDMEFIKEECIS